MLRSRRFALAAAAVLLGLSACGDAGSTTTAGKSPAVIHIGAAGNGGKVAATAEGVASDRMMPYANITYVYDGAYPDLGTSAPAWMLPAGADVDEAKVAALAALFGVDGEVRRLPADQGGGWMVGAPDYTTANLNVSSDGMASWWYSPAPSVDVARGGCAVPVAVEEASSSGGGTDAAPPEGTLAVPETTVVDTACVEEVPEPPVGVPTTAEAEAATNELLADLGLDPAAYELTSYADEWGANVTAYLLLGGHRSPLSLNVGFGENGAITWASGTLAQPQPAAEYPLVSTEAGVARLNDQSGQWGWFGYGGGVGMMRGAVEDVAVAPADNTGGGAAGVAGDQPITAPVCDPANDCVIEPMPMDEITVTLTSVRLDLTMVWDEDGTVWLLPAYTYTSTDGGEYTIIAVDESLLAMPEPTPVETVPVETIAPDPTVVVTSVPSGDFPAPDVTFPDTPKDALAAIVVGMSVDEATKLAEANGWTLRVSTLDGEGQALTEDYSVSRMNVAVEAGVVTAVEFIG